MLRLRSSVPHHRADDFGALLRQLDGVHRVARQPDESRQAEHHVFVADVEPSCADRLVEEVGNFGVTADDYVLSKTEVVAPLHHHHHDEVGIDGF